MIFKDILVKQDIEQLLEYINANYDDDSDMSYRKVFDKLKLMTPKTDKNMILVVATQKDELEKNEYTYYDVTGYSKEDKTFYAIEFTPWEDWLGMTVPIKNVEELGEVVYVGECLREMTFISYDEEDIKGEIDALNALTEKIKSGEEKTYPIEDLFKEFNYVDERTEEEKEADEKYMKEAMEWNRKEIFRLVDSVDEEI